MRYSCVRGVSDKSRSRNHCGKLSLTVQWGNVDHVPKERRIKISVITDSAEHFTIKMLAVQKSNVKWYMGFAMNDSRINFKGNFPFSDVARRKETWTVRRDFLAHRRSLHKSFLKKLSRFQTMADFYSTGIMNTCHSGGRENTGSSEDGLRNRQRNTCKMTPLRIHGRM